ncbi:MAG: phosphatidate cytidylyltransferase [Candidatus Omnitrophota bacterium]
MNKFLKRTVATVFLLIFAGSIIYLAPNWMFCGVIAIIVGLGQFDFFRMIENRKIFVYKYFGTIVGCCIPVVILIGNNFSEFKNLEPMVIVVASLLALTLQLTRRDNAQDHLIGTALTLFSLFYISWFFSFILKLRLLENGANLVAFLILVTKSTDMGAYVIGSWLGKTEFIPRISPKKTWEGTLGGIFVAVMVSLIAGRFFTEFSAIHLFVLGILISFLGQTGDLAESLIKRDCGVKDSGIYVPGIGGALDLVDSLLFTAPIFYFYIKMCR